MTQHRSPLVSVIIPTYNRAHILDLSITSVLNQTIEDIEVIIVDDASTDETSSLVANMNDARIHYICLKHNRGANVARNTGISQARGQYIAFQDSDDEWLPHKLEKQLLALEQLTKKKGIVYCQYQRIENGSLGRVFGKPFNPNTLLRQSYIGTPTMVAHRSCFIREQFDEMLPRRQDWEICLRLMQKYPFVFVPEVLVLSHTSQRSVSQSPTILQAYEYIFTKHHALIRQGKRATAEFHHKIGIFSIVNGEWSKGKSNLVRAVRTWPFDVRYWARATAAVLGPFIYSRLFS